VGERITSKYSEKDKIFGMNREKMGLMVVVSGYD
jgi:hypothetical protein